MGPARWRLNGGRGFPLAFHKRPYANDVLLGKPWKVKLMGGVRVPAGHPPRIDLRHRAFGPTCSALWTSYTRRIIQARSSDAPPRRTLSQSRPDGFAWRCAVSAWLPARMTRMTKSHLIHLTAPPPASCRSSP